MYTTSNPHEMGTLMVLIYYPDIDQEHLLWEKRYGQGNAWNYGSVTFTPQRMNYNVSYKFRIDVVT